MENIVDKNLFFEVDKYFKYFVETGTFEGGSVQIALDHGYEQVFSNEIFEIRYNKCMEVIPLFISFRSDSFKIKYM